jgi:hypothetical protein
MLTGVSVEVINPYIKDSSMTIFRRNLTTLSLFGVLALAAGAATFGLDFYFEARQQELLAFITGATPVRSGDDLAKLEGRLVYAAGKPTATRTMADPDLGLQFGTISLTRETEIYQWIQDGHKHPKYRTVWVDAPVNSKSFKRPDGHENRGDLEFQPYGDRSEAVTVSGVSVDPSFIASVKERLVPITENMLSQLPESVRSRYVLDHGRLVETAPVRTEQSDPARVGTNRISYRAMAPNAGVVVGFMHDGRIVPGETDPYGRVGEYIPGATDLSSTITGIEEANAGGHTMRLASAFAMIFLALGMVGRDFSTAKVVEKPLRFGR